MHSYVLSPWNSNMSRQIIVRLLLAVTLLLTLAACGKSPTAPDARVKTHDSAPWV